MHMLLNVCGCLELYVKIRIYIYISHLFRYLFQNTPLGPKERLLIERLYFAKDLILDIGDKDTLGHETTDV